MYTGITALVPLWTQARRCGVTLACGLQLRKVSLMSSPFFKLQRRMSEYLPASLVPALVPALAPAPHLAAGKVWLIGAGPGDPELLTLKAARILGSADVILLDDLVNRAVLAHVRTGARVIEVGKRGGCKSTPQAFIERLMIRCARSGKIVARLKGGDPFVFGRGGEEVLALEAAGVSVEIISGITAGIAAPAAVGIPVTHRGLARGVTLVTAHTRDGVGPDWQALAALSQAAGTTLVIYMGMKGLAATCDQLVRAGLDATTPAAAIQSGTCAGQQHVTATLATLAAAVASANLASPAIIVIGAVACLARDGINEMIGASAPARRAA